MSAAHWLTFVIVFCITFGLLIWRRQMAIRSKILDILKERGEQSSLQLSEHLGLGVYHELRVLADAGIVNRRERAGSDGTSRVYYSLPKPS